MGTKAQGTGHRASSGNVSGNAGRFGTRGVKVALACASVLACVSVMSGCELFGEPKVESPFTHAPATAAEIRGQAEAAAKKAADDAKAQAETMAANLKAETDEQAVKAARRKAEFDRAVAELDADTRVKLAALQAEYEIAGQETALRLGRMAADTERAVAALNANAAAKIDAVRASTDAALAAIRRIGEQREAGLGLVTGAVSAVPGWGAVIASGLTGLAGIAWGNRGKAKAADTAWDQGVASANAARDKADALYDEGKRESELATVLAALIGKAVGTAPGTGTPTS